jgi:hypothetical protein
MRKFEKQSWIIKRRNSRVKVFRFTSVKDIAANSNYRLSVKYQIKTWISKHIKKAGFESVYTTKSTIKKKKKREKK